MKGRSWNVSCVISLNPVLADRRQVCLFGGGKQTVSLLCSSSSYISLTLCYLLKEDFSGTPPKFLFL